MPEAYEYVEEYYEKLLGKSVYDQCSKLMRGGKKFETSGNINQKITSHFKPNILGYYTIEMLRKTDHDIFKEGGIIDKLEAYEKILLPNFNCLIEIRKLINDRSKTDVKVFDTMKTNYENELKRYATDETKKLVEAEKIIKAHEYERNIDSQKIRILSILTAYIVYYLSQHSTDTPYMLEGPEEYASPLSGVYNDHDLDDDEGI